MTKLACIILAAGNSERFGSNKMLHVLVNGKSVIETVAEKYQAIFDQITVVVRSNEIIEHPLLGHKGVTILAAHNAEQGLSQSLITGVQAHPDSDGWLIALGDMPYLQSETIQRIVDAMAVDQIVAPLYNTQQGNPVGFGKNFLSQLLALKGDAGAKKLFAQFSKQFVEIPTDDEGVSLDIDRPEDCR